MRGSAARCPSAAAGLLTGLALLGAGGARAAESSELSDEAKPYDVEGVPDRPRPLLELGEPFLGSGPLSEGITLPTGAVWRPSVLIWGTLRTAIQTFESAVGKDSRSSEWGNRLDIFGQLRVSPTERLVVGFRPVDEGNTYSGYQFEPERGDGWVDGLNGDFEQLFFEGDFGEIFPRLDPEDARRLDFGFSVGRQPLILQDGMLLLDNIDSVGIVRNNLFLPGTSNTRATLLFGWADVNRDDNRNDHSARLYGLFLETDAPWSTINLDLAGIDASDETGSGLYGGMRAASEPGDVPRDRSTPLDQARFASAEELEALRAELGSLRAEILEQSLEAERRQRVGEANRDSSPPPGARPAVLERAIPSPHESSQRDLAHELVVRLETEEPDGSWAASAEEDLVSSLTVESLEGLSVSGARCVATLCRVDLSFVDLEAREATLDLATTHLPWLAEGYLEIDPDDPLRAAIFVAREGQPLEPPL